MHERADLVALVLEREVAGVEEVELRIGKVAQVRTRAVGGEDRVVPAPDDERRRAARAEEVLELGKPVDVIGDGESFVDWLVAAGLLDASLAATVKRANALDAAAAEARKLRVWATEWISR